MRGRFELYISWKPPEVPLGKITRYDVKVNGDTMYSGMALHYDACRLRPDTEYAITVSVEGGGGGGGGGIGPKGLGDGSYILEGADYWRHDVLGHYDMCG